MRRTCTALVLVSSLLVATTPANAKPASDHRQEARAGASQAHVKKTQRIKRARGIQIHKYTYGRT